MSYSCLTADEVVNRGEKLYQENLLPWVETAGNKGKFLVLDVKTGDYEIHQEDLAASQQLLARHPDALLYGVRIGHPTAYRTGNAHLPVYP
ncbi:MAG: hypothetical protein KY468_18390 [Armatimonadetes bacterium]|nr:hypothetical protein [Armatimonadota bacterium]